MTIADSAQRVVARLMGPGVRSASGAMPLGYAEFRALPEQRLSLLVVPTNGDQPVLRYLTPD
jgi:hypothetical protein